jgi:hypothetical protein
MRKKGDSVYLRSDKSQIYAVPFFTNRVTTMQRSLNDSQTQYPLRTIVTGRGPVEFAEVGSGHRFFTSTERERLATLSSSSNSRLYAMGFA